MNLRFFFALEWEVHRVWLRGREEEQRKKSEGIVDLKRIRSEGKAKENWTRIGVESEEKRTCFLQGGELRWNFVEKG